MHRQRHQAKIKDDRGRRVAAPGARNHQIGECHQKSRQETQPTAEGIGQVSIGMQQQIKPDNRAYYGNPIDEPIFLLQQKGAQEGYPHPVGGREKTALTRADSLDRHKGQHESGAAKKATKPKGRAKIPKKEARVFGPKSGYQNHDQVHHDPDEADGCGRHRILEKAAGVDPIPHQRKEHRGNEHIEDAAPRERLFEGSGALFHDDG